MTPIEQLKTLVIQEGIVDIRNKPHLNHLGSEAGFEIFDYLGQGNRAVAISDEADYLRLFMQVAEGIYSERKPDFANYIVASDMGGHRLYLKEFTPEEKQEFKYAHVVLLNAFKLIPDKFKPETFSFFGELNLVDSSEERFEKESKKTARILSGEIQENWQKIAENQYHFLKTDLYVYSLLKLYSWGFQFITPEGTVDAEQNCVRAIRPKARGTSRH
jgi:hypothetical protein